MKLTDLPFIISGEKPFKCYRCPEDFRDLKSLKRHNLVDHLTNKIYVCDICKDDFDLFRNFNFHRKEHLKSEYKEMITEQIQAEVYDMTSRYEMDGENSVNVECDSGLVSQRKIIKLSARLI